MPLHLFRLQAHIILLSTKSLSVFLPLVPNELENPLGAQSLFSYLYFCFLLPHGPLLEHIKAPPAAQTPRPSLVYLAAFA